ncbi:hypothetical protein QQS21_006008 [Conoideocrella luteorostrata]|uniref:Lysine-specific metallo-endopeptidase domain-containing protein n=1 Tax=Conoideocrella luteorostrata TaxID=1105319 RepID=A0AAJ0CND7_9HYPO|nr:hypothetical protein QQS21_006008 [Conoideocrella luteorostrata]
MRLQATTWRRPHGTSLSAVFVLLAFAMISHAAWVLDSSCKEYEVLVKKAMSGAMDLNQAGLDLMKNMKKEGSGPTWDAQNDLVNWLFNEATTNGKVDPNGEPWHNITITYDNIATKYSTIKTAEQDAKGKYVGLDTNDVVIYCDYSRFVKGQDCKGAKRKNAVCDKSLDRPLDVTFADRAKSRGEQLLCENGFIIQAWTFIATIDKTTWQEYPAQVQLCPGYLTKWSKAKFQTWGDQTDKILPAQKWKAIISKMVKVGDVTPMGVASTMDTTLLHELTHAIPINTKDDVDGNVGSYGWKNCVRLSKTKFTVWYKKAINNADNFAYFALGARMISPRDKKKQPLAPTEDGDIRPIIENKSTKRSTDEGVSDEFGDNGGIARRDGFEQSYIPGDKPTDNKPPSIKPTPTTFVTSTSSPAVVVPRTGVNEPGDGNLHNAELSLNKGGRRGGHSAKKTGAKKTEAKKTEARKTEAKTTEAKKTEAKKTEAKKTEAKKTESKKTEATKTDAKKTESKKTDATKTNATKTNTTKTNTTKTNTTKTNTTKTNTTKTDATKTDVTKPDVTKTEATKTDVTKTNATRTDKKKTDTGKPVTTKTDDKTSTGKTVTTRTDDKKTETGKPVTTRTDDKETETEKTVTTKTDDKTSTGKTVATKTDDKTSTGKTVTTRTDDKKTEIGKPVATKTDDKISTGKTVTTRTDDKKTETGKPVATKTDDKTSTGKTVTTRTDDKKIETGKPVATKTDDKISTGKTVTTRTDDKKTETGKPVTTKTDGKTSTGNTVATRTDDKETETGKPVTTKTDDKTSTGKTVATRTDDKKTETGKTVTTKTDDKTSTGKTVTTRTDDKTSTGKTVTTRTDDKETETGKPVATKTDDKTNTDTRETLTITTAPDQPLVTPIPDNFLELYNNDAAWYDRQQDILAEVAAEASAPNVKSQS